MVFLQIEEGDSIQREFVCQTEQAERAESVRHQGIRRSDRSQHGQSDPVSPFLTDCWFSCFFDLFDEESRSRPKGSFTHICFVYV